MGDHATTIGHLPALTPSLPAVWYAVCTCGWQGANHQRLALANEDASYHLASARVVEGRRAS